MIGSVIDCLSKVDKDGKLCVYHPINVLLPTRGTGLWIVHDELESLQKQVVIDLGKFLENDIAIDRITIVAAGLAAIATFLDLVVFLIY